jgi:hypothetical protein
MVSPEKLYVKENGPPRRANLRLLASQNLERLFNELFGTADVSFRPSKVRFRTVHL